MAAQAMSMAAAAVLPTTVPAAPLHLKSTFKGTTLRVQTAALGFPQLAISSRPLTVLAATKKAVAVLKGTSAVEGVVNLTQEDDGE